MNKSRNFKIIILAAVLAFVFNFLFGRYLMAKISTWPLLNRFKILSPQAPIVINTREEVRVSDDTDPVKALSTVKTKLATVFVLKNGQAVALGSGLNITNDGIVLAPASILPAKKKDSPVLYLKFYDGRFTKVELEVIDPYTKLAFLKTGADNLPVSYFFESRLLQLGQKLIAVFANMGSQSVGYLQTYVATFKGIETDSVFSTDASNQAFNTPGLTEQVSGTVLVNANGEITGMWDGSSIVPSHEIKNLLQLYLKSEKIIRPGFGFSYKLVQDWQKSLLNLESLGAWIPPQEGVLAGGAAAKAGLLADDELIAIDGIQITGRQSLEDVFQKYKPGDKLKLTVIRGKDTLELTLTVGELK